MEGSPADPGPAPIQSRRAARAKRVATGEHPVIIDAPLADEPVLVDDVIADPSPVLDIVPVEEPVVEAQPTEASAPAMEPVLASADEFELVEPAFVAEDAPAAEAIAESAPASEHDEFEVAARLFSFTGETPIQAQAAPQTEVDEVSEADAEPVVAAVPHVAPRRLRRIRVADFKRAAATSFSIGVVGVVGLLTVGMTTPAEAVAAAGGTTTDLRTKSASVFTVAGNVEVDPGEIQAYVTPAEIQSAAVERNETYATVSMAEVASELGISHPSSFYVNDPNAAIQWPFAVGVGITFGFGMRDGRMHEGADFVPGAGSHVQAIADGTVRISTDSGGAYGVTVVIDHIIDGQLISSRYAHMQVGSRQVQVGDHVTVGTFLGRTGNTGRSFGAHTHVEILKNGTTPIDPIAWFRANAGRDSLG